MFCNRCKVIMKKAWRFENGKAYTLHKCPKCHYESKPVPYFFKDEKQSRKTTKPTNKKRKEIKR